MEKKTHEFFIMIKASRNKEAFIGTGTYGALTLKIHYVYLYGNIAVSVHKQCEFVCARVCVCAVLENLKTPK